MLASILMAASAGIILAMGTLHLVYTFRSPYFLPRDPTLEARMRETQPRLTRETSMWNAWIGFNASHSLGAMLFGLVYGYLALVHAELLFSSGFLLAVGLGLLVSLAVLGKIYWFRVPFQGVSLSLFLYVASLVASRG